MKPVIQTFNVGNQPGGKAVADDEGEVKAQRRGRCKAILNDPIWEGGFDCRLPRGCLMGEVGGQKSHLAFAIHFDRWGDRVPGRID